MGDDTPPFEIGLVMAGAISAGAYSAGVIDFIVEAIDAYESARLDGRTREGEPWTGPTHPIRVPVIAGASAGGMTAAMAALQLHARFDHVGPGAALASAERNRLYASWVDEIGIEPLLETRDLDDGAKLKSLLCSSVLDEIVARSLAIPTEVDRAWLGRGDSSALAVLLTVSNTGGVPYAFRVAGAQSGDAYAMLNHGDDLRFLVGRALGDQAHRDGFDILDLARRDTDAMKRFGTAALATGAFPVGLAPRVIRRPFEDYAQGDRVGAERILANGDIDFQPIPPVPWEGEGPHTFVAVDGGMIDNEPFELARRYLSRQSAQNPGNRDGYRTRYAAILVDPFPNRPTWPADDGTDALSALVPRLLSMMVDQARFKPQELALALDENVRSRFAILPEPVTPTPLSRKLPIACGALGGFSGFLHHSFRHHDYCLGRRNAQAFLRWHFCLPENNPLFDRWKQGKSEAELEAWYVENPPTAGAADRFRCILDAVPDEGTQPPDEKQPAEKKPPEKKRALPIIPLTPRLRAEIDLGPDDRPRPDLLRRDLDALEDRLDRRFNAVIERLVDDDLADLVPGGVLGRVTLKHVLPGILTRKARKSIDEMVDQISAAFPGR